MSARFLQPVRASSLILLLVAGCSHPDPYLWVDDLRGSEVKPQTEYSIQPGDVIAVTVWNQDKMSARARVRNDGAISMPFLGDVQVAGKKPGLLGKELDAKLKEFILNPMSTVSVEELHPVSISVVGEVARSGAYPLEPGSGVLQALAAAGGLTDYANKDRVFVLRANPDGRIRFTYDALVRRTGQAARFQLRSGDVVVVE